MCTAKGMDESCWFDDPIFDEVKERVDGNMLCGDEWRRCIQVKEKEKNVQVLSVAGVTFRVTELERAVKKGARRVGQEARRHRPPRASAALIQPVASRIVDHEDFSLLGRSVSRCLELDRIV